MYRTPPSSPCPPPPRRRRCPPPSLAPLHVVLLARFCRDYFSPGCRPRRPSRPYVPASPPCGAPSRRCRSPRPPVPFCIHPHPLSSGASCPPSPLCSPLSPPPPSTLSPLALPVVAGMTAHPLLPLIRLYTSAGAASPPLAALVARLPVGSRGPIVGLDVGTRHVGVALSDPSCVACGCPLSCSLWGLWSPFAAVHLTVPSRPVLGGPLPCFVVFPFSLARTSNPAPASAHVSVPLCPCVSSVPAVFCFCLCSFPPSCLCSRTRCLKRHGPLHLSSPQAPLGVSPLDLPTGLPRRRRRHFVHLADLFGGGRGCGGLPRSHPWRHQSRCRRGRLRDGSSGVRPWRSGRGGRAPCCGPRR